ncbi:glycosyltransferase family 4 protein [Edaphobacter modestus]|uniref:Glycosyltransferase involved in cell wall biosynthesis n=1 Tax=Edaphobacter modestus TaxID=388466 RepID=A0A4Q7YX19_9BACT|nr:glycosyltransferase family 4 protein [Edaphobacter modestus]RZU41619.1 glycosyltransferase involved in cell wall biosynthesis [Edaphobacter modestus]
MRDVTVFVGGSTGSEPYSPRTWSGISPFLLKAMEQNGLLHAAVGIRVPKLPNALLLAKNFSRNRAVWRKHFYFDPMYRRALTRAAASVRVETPVLMQIGHMFSLPQVFPAHKCVSYHDGNLPELLASGYGVEGVSRRRIDQALRFEEQAARQMTAIFTFSEYLRQSFIKNYGVPAEKVFAVGGAINLETVPDPDPNKDYRASRILFIGTEFARKGGPQLLQAFRVVRESIPSAELHIVGPTQISNLPAGAVLHGHLSKADPEQRTKLESLFREATLFALPSLYEPFGIAPLEAMLYQVPAVVTNAWALREFVTPGFNGALVEKGSVEDLATKLTQMLSNPDRLAAMGRQGREMVLARYTWASVVDRMAVVVRSL